MIVDMIMSTMEQKQQFASESWKDSAPNIDLEFYVNMDDYVVCNNSNLKNMLMSNSNEIVFEGPVIFQNNINDSITFNGYITFNSNNCDI